MRLDNDYVLITGASRRLGRVMALAVAKAGGNVIIHHAHSPHKALETKREIEHLGQHAHILQADFQHPEEARKLIFKAFEHSPLYALVNSASIFGNLNWETTTLDDWDAHFKVNLTAPFLLSQSFAKHIAPPKEGRIINILDWRATRPRGDHFPYTISKAALAAMTKSLASSLAPSISVNGLALGAMLPPSDDPDVDEQAIISDVPAGRWADMQELEESLMFLLTGPTYITGEIIHLDGGRHLI
ncbi:MAG: SDR family NAD(P)-dependent oxidoreductase [Anaerolineales bacterium]